MLGSTADSLFWMFRYIERVENTLCMIESGFQLYLLSSNNLYNEWDAILKTNSIRHHFLKKNNSLESKKDIIEHLWKVIISDNTVDQYESNLMRRICGLIYFPDKESAEIKLNLIQKK